MAVRLIAGRAGAGKTHACIEGVARELERSLVEGTHLILLVPEQAALQTERRILARLQPHATTLGRCDVLSFRRLARRILVEAPGRTPTPLTPRGRQMALRYLISRHAGELREFGNIAERPGFIAELSRGMAELFQENVGLEQLEELARRAAEDDDAVAARLHDVAILFRAYLDFLGNARVDPEGVLDLARARLDSAEWLRGARVWVDGFASLAGQQLRLIAGLARIASHVEVALLLDPRRAGAIALDSTPDARSLFARTETTWSRLLRTFADDGIPVEPAHLLMPATPPRFHAAPLAALESRLFSPGAMVAAASAGERRTGAGPVAVRLARARDRRAEVNAAVRAMLDLVQRDDDPLRYRDIAIMVRDLEPYHDLVSVELQRHGIPYFIDRRRPTYHHPLVQLVRALMSLAAGTSFQAPMASLLKTGLCGVDDSDADAIENYALAHNLRWPASWTRKWTRPPQRDYDSAALPDGQRRLLDRLNTARSHIVQALGDWWPAHADMKDRASAREWTSRLYDALERLGIRATLESWSDRADAAARLDEAAEHEHVWNEFLALLEELAAGLADLPLSAAAFRDVVEAGLAEFTLGLVPATLDQVLVGGVERSRQPDLRAVFLLGFSDGLFPRRVAEDTIFTDAERRLFDANRLPLGRPRAQQILDERMLAYVALTRASQFLWVSYPESDERGRAILPSPYWARLRDALPDVPVEAVGDASEGGASTSGDLAAALTCALRTGMSAEAAALPASTAALYEWCRTEAPHAVRNAVARALASLRRPPEATLSAEHAARLWPAPHRTSVTRLESFAWCAYQHFAAHGLRLAEREVHEITPLHLGNLYHAMLEEFVNDLRAGQARLADLSLDDIRRRLDHVVDKVLPEYAERLSLDDDEKKLVRWRSRNEIYAALRAQKATIARTKLRPHLLERRFGYDAADDLPALVLSTPAGRHVRIRGKIDRVDLLDTPRGPLAVVYDYKRTQHRRLDLAAVFHGLEQQLLAYLVVLRDGGNADTAVIPGGAFYLPLLGSFASVDHPSDAAQDDALTFDGFRPHGVYDFDWHPALEPQDGDAALPPVFRSRTTQKGELGWFDQATAVHHDDFVQLLEHVRARMAELGDRWLDGDISVRPARLRDRLPCKNCRFRSVCRFEFVLNDVRDLPGLKRSDVVARLRGEGVGE